MRGFITFVLTSCLAFVLLIFSAGWAAYVSSTRAIDSAAVKVATGPGHGTGVVLERC
jgi:hypothetical protein